MSVWHVNNDEALALIHRCRSWHRKLGTSIFLLDDNIEVS